MPARDAQLLGSGVTGFRTSGGVATSVALHGLQEGIIGNLLGHSPRSFGSLEAEIGRQWSHHLGL